MSAMGHLETRKGEEGKLTQPRTWANWQREQGRASQAGNRVSRGVRQGPSAWSPRTGRQGQAAGVGDNWLPPVTDRHSVQVAREAEPLTLTGTCRRARAGADRGFAPSGSASPLPVIM